MLKPFVTRSSLATAALVLLSTGCYASAGLGYGSDRTLSAQASAGLSFSLGGGSQIHASAGAATVGAVASGQGMLSASGEDTKIPGHLVIGASFPVWRTVAVALDIQPPIGGQVRRFGESTTFETGVGRYYLGVGQQASFGTGLTGTSMLAYSFGPELFAHTDSRSTDHTSLVLAGKVTFVVSPSLVLKGLNDLSNTAK